MSVRRLHHEQPESFAFTPANLEWAKGQIAKYPEGRQASAVIPLLWRAQEQEGWVSRPAIEEVARMLDMASIRVLEIATFYFMFQLQPVGKVAHIQICGTTSCMLCGAEDLVAVCKEKIAPSPHQVSVDGKFSWEEVECLGACTNAPMAQIGKDYYEDLTTESFGQLLERFAKGEVPRPGPQNGRWASEPLESQVALVGDIAEAANGSIYLAETIGDTIKRIDGTEPTASDLARARGTDAPAPVPEEEPKTAEAKGDVPPEETERGTEKAVAKPDIGEVAPEPEAPAEPEPAAEAAPVEESEPVLLSEARGGTPDDLKQIKGVGPKLEGVLHEMGIFHFDQIAAWTPAEVAWVDERLQFKGRIERDDWIAQAKELAGGDA
ncbi:NADH-quinone oxidoreductase subunit E [Rhodobacteraceae bacterium NNCM2]|nr:NADH-quinone oxidoreductase subunit E [Coraliihabitans acroporae]